MNTIFDALSTELSSTNQQLTDVRTLASDSNEPDFEAAASVLEASQLEVYGVMQDMVSANPVFVDICVRALQRSEVIEYVIRRSAEQQLSEKAAEVIGQLATSNSAERENLEAFFTLFAPDNQMYRQITGPEPESDSQKDDKNTKGKAERKRAEEVILILVNGEQCEVTELEACALLRMQSAQTDPDAELKAAEVLKFEEFNELLYKTVGRELSYASKANRFQRMREKLNAQFPDIFIEGGIRGGAWITFNTAKYKVTMPDTLPTEEGVEQSAPMARVTQPEKKVDEVSAPQPREEKTWGSPASSTTRAPRQNLKTERPAKDIGHRRRSKEAGVTPEVAPTTNSTRLLSDGYMIDRRRTPYTGLESAVVHLINSAERKEPYSPSRIATEIRASGQTASSDEVDRCLKELAGKLPRGWLIKVPTGPSREDGWRLGKGVRIRKQHVK